MRPGLAPILALLCLSARSVCAAAGHAAPQVPYVIEMFTSQGCSSCPPADKLLAKLAQEPGVIALTLPVDYWDYMGWKDTLASPIFTQRQKAYASERGDGHVYTPQAVIDGLVHTVGSNKRGVEEAATQTYGSSGALSISMKLRKTADGVNAEVGSSSDGAESGSLILVRLAKKITVQIRGGENAGRTLTYTNVVRSIQPFALWKGKSSQFTVPLTHLDTSNDAYVVLLQAGDKTRPGVILGAVKGASPSP